MIDQSNLTEEQKALLEKIASDVEALATAFPSREHAFDAVAERLEGIPGYRVAMLVAGADDIPSHFAEGKSAEDLQASLNDYSIAYRQARLDDDFYDPYLDVASEDLFGDPDDEVDETPRVG